MPGFRRFFSAILLFALLGGAAWFAANAYLTSRKIPQSQRNQTLSGTETTAAAENPKPVLFVNCEHLLLDHSENQLAFEERYSGKRIRIHEARVIRTGHDSEYFAILRASPEYKSEIRAESKAREDILALKAIVEQYRVDGVLTFAGDSIIINDAKFTIIRP